MAVARRSETQAQRASQQLALLDELKNVATQLGFEVREEKLLREVGYHVRSGSCRVRENHVIFLDRNLPPSAHIDVLAEELAKQPLDDLYLSPTARRLLEAAAPVQASPAEGTPAATPPAADPNAIPSPAAPETTPEPTTT